MTRTGILSDTHLTKVGEDFKRILRTLFHGVDMIIHAGDMTSMEVYDYLSNWRLRAVRGNMDEFNLTALLPDKRIEEIEGKRIGIMHGRGSPYGIEDLVLNEFTEVDVIIFGHSHIPLNTVKKGTFLFNPGSFKGTYGHPGTVGIMEIDGGIKARHLKAE